MKSFLKATFITLLFLALNGCGTTMNLELDRTSPYRGVGMDLYVMSSVVKKPSAGSAVMSLAAAADLPLSIVGDTVTAPFIFAGGIQK
jgi:uncharacterized protein YceK